MSPGRWAFIMSLMAQSVQVCSPDPSIPEMAPAIKGAAR